MLKVLIADDEPIIREGILHALDWELANCRVVGEADHGASAMSLLAELQPDIVICDIQMPGVDGIELARHIRENQLDMKIIFVTGYDEFSYASEAVKNNVSDFILKPVDSSILLQAVENAKQALIQARKMKRENAQFKWMLETHMPILRENFIKQLLLSQLANEEEIREKISFFDMAAACYQLMIFEIDNYGEVARNRSEYERLFCSFAVKNAILERFAPFGKAYVIEHELPRFVLLCGFGEATNSLSVIEHVAEHVQQQLHISLSCGLSGYFQDLANAGYYYKQARSAVSHKFYLGNNSIIHIDDIANGSNMKSPGGNGKQLKQIVDLIKAGRRDQLKEHLVQLLDPSDSPERELDITYRTKCRVIELIVSVMKELEEIGIESFPILTEDQVYSRVLDCETLHDIVEYVHRLIANIIDSNRSNKNIHYNQVVDRAIEYINLYYYEDISLNDVAGFVHVNASYLSRIIKKVTGDNFVGILTKARIERAKSLLKEVNYKTYEVASMVGVQDSKYFSSLFKREVGLTPTEYRNLYSAT